MTLPADRTKSPQIQPVARDRLGLAKPWRLLILRLHFYAGIFVAPFLAVAALTGLAYVFSPQLESLLYAEQLHTESGGRTALPVSEQVAAARAVHPEGAVAEIVPAASATDTTRVVFKDPEIEDDRQRTVFVDPYTASVRGTLVTWFGYTPVRAWLDDTHRNLQMGSVGRHYSEVAASWLWVVVLGGLYLWWQRAAGRRLFVPDLGARKGVRRTRGWHAATGVWLTVGLLFLSVTGLTWSRWAGGNFDRVLTAVGGKAPQLSAEVGHHEHAVVFAEEVQGVDEVLAAASSAGVDQAVKLTPPADGGGGWLVAENDRSIPVHLDRAVVQVNPAHETGEGSSTGAGVTGAGTMGTKAAGTVAVGSAVAGARPTGTVTASTVTASTVTASTVVAAEVVAVSRFADWPLLAQATKLGIAAHMGLLFGLANQILLAALAIGLVCVIIWGYRMWWQRRPTGARVGHAPKPGVWKAIPRHQLAVGVLICAAVGWLMPVLGATLVGFLVVDFLRQRASAERTSASRSDPPAPVARTRPDSST